MRGARPANMSCLCILSSPADRSKPGENPGDLRGKRADKPLGKRGLHLNLFKRHLQAGSKLLQARLNGIAAGGPGKSDNHEKYPEKCREACDSRQELFDDVQHWQHWLSPQQPYTLIWTICLIITKPTKIMMALQPNIVNPHIGASRKTPSI